MQNEFHVRLVGTRYRPIEAQIVAANLADGEALHLEREPLNPHDENAIKVYARKQFIGYVASGSAAEIAPILDTEQVSIDATWQDGRIVMFLRPYEITPDES